MVAILVAFVLRQHPRDPDGKRANSRSAASVQTAREARPVRAMIDLPKPPNPLANLVPDLFASPEQRIRNLYASGDPFAAQVHAARSGDPLLIAHALDMTLHCMSMPVQLHGRSVRQLLTEYSFDPKTGKKIPPNEALIAMNEAMQTVMPLRIQPPAEIAAEIAKLQKDWPSKELTDYARNTELLKKQAAPLSGAQRASFSATVERSASECRGRLIGKDFGGEYRAALDRLVANGVVSAQLFNRRAGWESEGLAQLTERDYDLLQRALVEWQPDGIAKMLIGSHAVTGPLDSSWMTDQNVTAALVLEFNLGVAAACALGVSDCGPDSTRFRATCVDLGGCDQPDLASLLRHVFERDGLDPALIDREINRVVDAYQRRDLDALGVRRIK